MPVLITLTLRDIADADSVDIRLRSLLKVLRRKYRFRCVSVSELVDEPEKPGGSTQRDASGEDVCRNTKSENRAAR